MKEEERKVIVKFLEDEQFEVYTDGFYCSSIDCVSIYVRVDVCVIELGKLQLPYSNIKEFMNIMHHIGSLNRYTR